MRQYNLITIITVINVFFLTLVFSCNNANNDNNKRISNTICGVPPSQLELFRYLSVDGYPCTQHIQIPENVKIDTTLFYEQLGYLYADSYSLFLQRDSTKTWNTIKLLFDLSCKMNDFVIIDSITFQHLDLNKNNRDSILYYFYDIEHEIYLNKEVVYDFYYGFCIQGLNIISNLYFDKNDSIYRDRILERQRDLFLLIRSIKNFNRQKHLLWYLELLKSKLVEEIPTEIKKSNDNTNERVLVRNFIKKYPFPEDLDTIQSLIKQIVESEKHRIFYGD